MKVVFFSCMPYEMPFFDLQDLEDLQVTFLKDRITEKEVVRLSPFEVAVVHSRDECTEGVLNALKSLGVKAIVVRASGVNNIDIEAANRAGIEVRNIPSYSPESIAEHALTLALALLKKLVQSSRKIEMGDFRLEGLVGNTLYRKKVGILGLGSCGKALVRLIQGFQCDLLGVDLEEDDLFANEYGLTYTSLEEVLRESDLVFLFLPLVDSTFHILNVKSLALCKKKALIINVGRGGLIDTSAALDKLNNNDIGGLGLDVYENEGRYFFTHHNLDDIDDPLLLELMNHPRVLLSGHKAFLTEEAMLKRTKLIFERIRE